MAKKRDCVGEVFGRLLVIKEDKKKPNKRRTVTCKCDCGDIKSYDPRNLFIGQTKSCGCLHREEVAKSTGKRSFKHGMSRSKEYRTWVHMKGRCFNVKNIKYPHYGARGISVCDEWNNSFEIFYKDMGPAPSIKHTIDRIDVNGDYEPNNCKWSNYNEQALNRRYHRIVNFKDKDMPLSQACRLAGVNYRSALYRLNTNKNWLPQAPKGEDDETK